MQTQFTEAQLADPQTRDSAAAVRKCVHCGFCTATCPTYVELGNELDSPRGRIYLMKSMLEAARPATDRDVLHIDRCLSCLSCMTTCPSGVNYMHLVDQSRAWIERTYRRPWHDRALRAVLATIITRPQLFRLSLRLAPLLKPFAPFLGTRVRAMLSLSPGRLPRAASINRPRCIPAIGTRRKRVALLPGCAQTVLAPQINEATVRLLTRLGCEVVIAEGGGCCGALTHHMGREEQSMAAARRNVDSWISADDEQPLDAIVVNASGCGTSVKDYGRLLRADARYADRAVRVASLARDVTEVVAELDFPQCTQDREVAITYHAACSLQHGQAIRDLPKLLLRRAGFSVREPVEAHLCCGSAGTYNLLQPKIAERLGERKRRAITETRPEMIATGNIGCMVQIARGLETPIVHTVELLDWATGGPRPAGINGKGRNTQ